jgi:hypothetical protein
VNPLNGAAVALVTDGRRISTGGDWFRIGQPNGDDAGRYRCQAANSQGQMESEFQLNVHGPLRARLEPQRQVSRISENAPFVSVCVFVSALMGHGCAEFPNWSPYYIISCLCITTFSISTAHSYFVSLA